MIARARLARRGHIRNQNVGNALVVAALAILVLFLTTGAAAASDAPQLSFTFSWVLFLQLVIAIVLPLVVGVVTKQSWSSGAKALLLAFLSVLSAMLTEILNAAQTGTVYDVGQGLFIGVGTFLTAVGIHYGLFKPTGATAAAQASIVHDTVRDSRGEPIK